MTQSQLTNSGTKLLMVAVAVLFFAAGFLANDVTSTAEASAIAPKIELGMTASEARKCLGQPAKIAFDNTMQTWFFNRGEGKPIAKKIVLNQGVVVRIY